MIQDKSANALSRTVGKPIRFDRGHKSGYRGYVMKTDAGDVQLGATAKQACASLLELIGY
jgi:hypothetical protein